MSDDYHAISREMNLAHHDLKRTTDIESEGGYYRGYFTLKKTGDTFLNMEAWGKGQAYINCSITLGGVFSSLVCGRLLDIKGPHFMLIVSLAVTTIGLVIAFFALKVWRTKTAEAKA